MKDYFTEKQEKIAAQLIKNYKKNESAILAEYGSRDAYFTKEMGRQLWQDEKIKAEFDCDFETLRAYLENSHRVTDHTSKIQRFTKADAPADDTTTTDDGIKNKWDADPSLIDEFGDFETFKAYQKNRGRVKVLHA